MDEANHSVVFSVRLCTNFNLLSTLNHTALLLFSRSAAAEAKYKNIFRRAKHNRIAAQGFIQHTYKIASQTNLPLHVCDERLQTGDSFGEKLANAMAFTFAKGYSKVIVIGNDCPGLTKACIEDAVTQLEQHELVLGPTAKGGVYLLGITAALFKKTTLEKISWQTATVFSELKDLAYATASGVSTLPFLDDINTANDVIAVAKKYSAAFPFTHVLLQYLRSGVFPRPFKKSILTFVTVCASGRRGPPRFCP